MPTCSFEAPAQVTHTLVLIILISSAIYSKHPLKGSPALMKKKKRKKKHKVHDFIKPAAHKKKSC